MFLDLRWGIIVRAEARSRRQSAAFAALGLARVPLVTAMVLHFAGFQVITVAGQKDAPNVRPYIFLLIFKELRWRVKRTHRTCVRTFFCRTCILTFFAERAPLLFCRRCALIFFSLGGILGGFGLGGGVLRGRVVESVPMLSQLRRVSTLSGSLGGMGFLRL